MNAAPAEVQRADIGRTSEGHVAILPGGERPLLDMDGTPLRDPGSGWGFRFLLHGFGPVALLELQHESGNQASWYLDERFAVVAHTLSDLPTAGRQHLRAAVGAAMEQAIRHILAGAPLRAPPAILDAAPDTLAQLMPPVPDDRPVVRLDQGQWGAILSEPADDGHAVAIPAARLARLMGLAILDLVAGVVRDGGLVLDSPVDGQPLKSDFALPLSHFVVAYRFLDRRNGVPFLLIATTHACTIVAAFFPNSTNTYVRNGWTADFLLAHHPGAPIGRILPQHVVRYLRPLLDYAALPARHPVFLYSHRHLGHHLWQDLGGLDAVRERIAPDDMPGIIMLNPRLSEMWGRLDVLFPDLAGKIDRSLNSDEELTLRAYHSGLCLFLPTGSRISPALADRIVAVAESDGATAADRTLLADLRRENVPIVLIGLRVENRTVVAFPAFVASLIEIVRAECSGRVAIVIDGHSAGDGGVFESHRQDVVRIDPLAIEREIADAAIAAVAGSPSIVIDTIGAPMARSLFWSAHADMFITPWGAGLAKYRWIGDRPGLVLASPLFQSGAADLRIYDDPNHSRASVHSRIIDPRHVTDAPEDPCVIPIAEPARINFRVDLAAVRDEVRALLATVEP